MCVFYGHHTVQHQCMCLYEHFPWAFCVVLALCHIFLSLSRVKTLFQPNSNWCFLFLSSISLPFQKHFYLKALGAPWNLFYDRITLLLDKILVSLKETAALFSACISEFGSYWFWWGSLAPRSWRILPNLRTSLFVIPQLKAKLEKAANGDRDGEVFTRRYTVI